MTYRLIDIEEIDKALLWLSKHWDRPIYPEYYNAETINEAVSLLHKYGERAKIIAGGTDIIGLMKNHVLLPEALINIKTVPDMKYIVQNSRGVAVGALTLINDIERSVLIRNIYPALSEAARSIASPQIRNMATIGGNLCQDVRCWYYRRSSSTGISFPCWRKRKNGICYAYNGENQYHAIIGRGKCFAVCPSDIATVLLALGAEINTVDMSGGRTIPIDELYTNEANVLKHNEVITGIQIPKIEANTKQRYLKFRLRKTIDFAIVSVAVVMTMHNNTVNKAKIVFGGVSQTPYQAVKAEEILKGEPLTYKLAEEAAKASVSNAIPLSKNSYKIQAIKALVKRALLE